MGARGDAAPFEITYEGLVLGDRVSRPGKGQIYQAYKQEKGSMHQITVENAVATGVLIENRIKISLRVSKQEPDQPVEEKTITFVASRSLMAGGFESLRPKICIGCVGGVLWDGDVKVSLTEFEALDLKQNVLANTWIGEGTREIGDRSRARTTPIGTYALNMVTEEGKTTWASDASKVEHYFVLDLDGPPKDSFQASLNAKRISLRWPVDVACSRALKGGAR